MWQVVWDILEGMLKIKESALPIQKITFTRRYVNHTAGIASTVR
jgi:hypothetical protein